MRRLSNWLAQRAVNPPLNRHGGSNPSLRTIHAEVVELDIHGGLKPRCLYGLGVRVPPSVL